MVKLKGIEWQHVVVVKEPEKHGMATLVRCAHCEKEFQGNAMRIRAHLLGNKRSAGVSGCPSCPEDARAELRIKDQEKALTKRKREARRARAVSSASDHSSESPQHMDLKVALRKGEKSALEQAITRMFFANSLPVNVMNAVQQTAASIAMTATDLDSFFEGFGLRGETISKIKDMGFTGKTFMSNLDELPSLLESINHTTSSLLEKNGVSRVQ